MLIYSVDSTGSLAPVILIQLFYSRTVITWRDTIFPPNPLIVKCDVRMIIICDITGIFWFFLVCTFHSYFEAAKLDAQCGLGRAG